MKKNRRIGERFFLILLVFSAAAALYPENQTLADSSTLYFAQMADGGGYITQIVLFNPGATDITAKLELFKSDGSPLTITLNGATDKNFSWTIKALGSLFLKSSGSGIQVNTGCVRVKSNGPIGGSLVYSYFSGGKAISEAGLDPSSPVTQFAFTVDTRQGYYSGLAVVNPNNTALDVRYALYDAEGKLKGRTSRKLDSLNHAAKLLDEIFPDQNLKEFTGVVTAFSIGGSMVATTLRFDAEVGTLASIPVAGGIPILAAGHLYAVDGIVGNLRYVPAGTFTQGSPSTEVGRESNEGPQFQHTLTKGMAVMETEVTRQMWADLRAAQPNLPTDPTVLAPGSTMNNPAQNMTWYETVLFANLLTQQIGLQQAYFSDGALTIPIDPSNYRTDNVFVNWNANGYRLPTEGEWEYFTRAGTTGPFWIEEPAYTMSTRHTCISGALSALESTDWFCANDIGSTSPAGSKISNPWGLKDVHGNVYEWCWDWYGSYPGSAQINYRGPSSGEKRASRGGCWNGVPWIARSASRFASEGNVTPSNRYTSRGFRLIRSGN